MVVLVAVIVPVRAVTLAKEIVLAIVKLVAVQNVLINVRGDVKIFVKQPVVTIAHRFVVVFAVKPVKVPA